MAKNPIRSLSSMMLTASRRLSTSSAPAAVNLQPLYHRLSELGTDPSRTVAQTMEEWIQQGKTITEFGLMNIVRELRRYRSYRTALELMDWIETRGLKKSASKNAVRIDLLAKVKGIHLAERYFSSLPSSGKNLQTYGALLNSYRHESMAAEAIDLYDKMKRLNLASTSLVHNNMMALYMKLGQQDKVQAIYQEMKANSIRPDTYTYGILMSSYGSLNDIDSVEKIIQEMEIGGVAFGWSTYVQLAGVYISGGLYEKADSVLKKVEQIMDKHNRNPFHFLISLYAGAGNLTEVHRVWKFLKEATFRKPINRSYCIMLTALSKLDDMDGLKQCFEEWESSYVHYDIKLVNVVIGAYLTKGMLKEAESLCKKAAQKRVGDDIRTIEMFMDYFLKRNEMDLALKCFEVATSHVGWKPDKEMLSAFLKYFQEVKDVEGAEDFCKSLKKLNCLDEGAYESLVRTYVAAGKKEPLLYDRIKEDGIKMSSECVKLMKLVCMTN